MAILPYHSPYRTIFDGRDATVINFPLPIVPENRAAQLAVVWDHDADKRITTALVALRMRDPRALANIVGVAEHRGKIDFWCTGQPIECARALASATDIALRPGDTWSVNDGIIVPSEHHVLDRSRVPVDHVLRTTIPERYALGLVRL